MKPPLLFLLVALICLAPNHLSAAPSAWVVKSPNHGQTFAYGSEHHRQWIMRGTNRHLALAMEFTNDPHVSRVEVRQYDYFIFDFPEIMLGGDGHTFYYHAPGGRAVPVATRHAGFLGIDEITLLDPSILMMRSPHGYLSLELIVGDQPGSHRG